MENSKECVWEMCSVHVVYLTCTPAGKPEADTEQTRSSKIASGVEV